ncbi:hypothetical protein JXO52_01680 [bacterium]|nr:hypothetical protein [bacterium]
MNSLNFIPLLTDANFDAAVTGEKTPLVVIVKTDWFGITYIMAPILQAIVREYKGTVTFFAVDYETNRRIAETFDVHNIITFLFFRNGNVVNRIVGPVSADVMRNTIEDSFF